MNKWIIIILSVLLCVSVTGWILTERTAKDRGRRIDEQSEVIDSLLSLPPSQSLSLDVYMELTDKSKFEVNGKNNQGTITVPSDKSYVLEVRLDSVSAYISK